MVEIVASIGSVWKIFDLCVAHQNEADYYKELIQSRDLLYPQYQLLRRYKQFKDRYDVKTKIEYEKMETALTTIAQDFEKNYKESKFQLFMKAGAWNMKYAEQIRNLEDASRKFNELLTTTHPPKAFPLSASTEIFWCLQDCKDQVSPATFKLKVTDFFVDEYRDVDRKHCFMGVPEEYLMEIINEYMIDHSGNVTPDSLKGFFNKVTASGENDRYRQHYDFHDLLELALSIKKKEKSSSKGTDAEKRQFIEKLLSPDFKKYIDIFSEKDYDRWESVIGITEDELKNVLQVSPGHIRPLMAQIHNRYAAAHPTGLSILTSPSASSHSLVRSTSNEPQTPVGDQDSKLKFVKQLLDGYDSYVQVFLDSGYDSKMSVKSITAETLKELKVRPGHIQPILSQIKSLLSFLKHAGSHSTLIPVKSFAPRGGAPQEELLAGAPPTEEDTRRLFVQQLLLPIKYPDYITAFLENGFDSWDSVLPLKKEDLKEMKVKIGHIPPLLAHIKKTYDQENQLPPAPKAGTEVKEEAKTEDGRLWWEGKEGDPAVHQAKKWYENGKIFINAKKWTDAHRYFLKYEEHAQLNKPTGRDPRTDQHLLYLAITTQEMALEKPTLTSGMQNVYPQAYFEWTQKYTPFVHPLFQIPVNIKVELERLAKAAKK